ncbi:MAG: protein kinase [Planctomycetaceae bacterium]|jgi:serine/threonine protein kinase|nr:protein kinase [Planctomycetaceae bacterium]MBT6153804.1 protein kinase [Planctomycetaceae bacterium]MBT6485751.1 protein kinase [Planctomycetaceae bacterium]MBT6497908.1 protein kinase [Planctomycetaceae bacterium]
MHSGELLGEYEIIGVIGRGGMGEVFKARHRLMDRVVAIKFTQQKYADDRDGQVRFLREIRASARLTHTNVITAFDAGKSPDGRPFLVTEYLNSTDLASVLQRRSPLPIEDVMRFIVQAAHGICHAHKQGVIHRDIKPSNLLLDETDTVQLCDFGLARVLDWDRPADSAENRGRSPGPAEPESLNEAVLAKTRPPSAEPDLDISQLTTDDSIIDAVQSGDTVAPKLEHEIDAESVDSLSVISVLDVKSKNVRYPVDDAGDVAGMQTIDSSVLDKPLDLESVIDDDSENSISADISRADVDTGLTLDGADGSRVDSAVIAEDSDDSNLSLFPLVDNVADDDNIAVANPSLPSTYHPPHQPISTRIYGEVESYEPPVRSVAASGPPARSVAAPRPPALDLDSADRLTAAGNLMGTPAYMSPEQCRSARDVDERADIYSLGCTLYHLLTGKTMYSYKNLGQLVMEQIEGEIPALAERRDDLPADLDGVYQKMVAKVPEERYQTMDEVIEALDAVGAKPKVFISYRRVDTIDATDRLFTELLPRFDSDHLFMDVDTIPAGVNFREHLHTAVSDCDVMLVVIGDHWVNAQHDDGTRRLDALADYVRIEIEAALELGVDIIPVLVGRAHMPAEHELPDSIRQFVYQNAAEIRAGREYQRGINRLANDIYRIWEEKRPRPY